MSEKPESEEFDDEEEEEDSASVEDLDLDRVIIDDKSSPSNDDEADIDDIFSAID